MIEPTDEMVTAAAEVAEDEMIRRLGRDLGTIHRDDIIRAILAAVLAIVERDQAGPCSAVLQHPIVTNGAWLWCALRHGHAGDHLDENGNRWKERWEASRS